MTQKTLLLFSMLLGLSSLQAQNSLLISARVDTTSEEVKSVIKLYENYYNAKPDSIYDNPFWNQEEKDLYHDFDFSRASIFQGGMNSEQLFQYFSPFVMSVESIGEKYQIRVLFSSSTSNPEYAGSKVWCIQKLNAVKEGEKWVLENLMIELSKDWLSQKYGLIEYVYPPTHSFNQQEAIRAEQFCNGIIQRFNPNYKGPFKYYVTSSQDEMGLLENFDYYFAGITTGKAREGMILSANGNEFYPHEFIHQLLPQNPDRGYLIEEGAAVFLGTKEDPKEYKDLLKQLATDLETEPEAVNFTSILSQELRFKGYPTAYPAGAALCELTHQLGGDKALSQLLAANTTNYEELLKTLCSITKYSEKRLEKAWLKTIKHYLQ